MKNNFERKIKNLKGFKNHNKWFLFEIIRIYSDFFKEIDISKIDEYDGDGACDMYHISIKFDTTDELWDDFEKLSDENKIQIDGTDEEFNIFNH